MTMQWRIEKILEATAGRLLCGPPTATFERVQIDSRAVRPGDLFVAIAGETHDGHDFIEEVSTRGGSGWVVRDGHPITRNLAAWERSGALCVAVPDTVKALGALAAFQRSRFAIPVVAITGSNGKTSTRQMTTHVLEQRYATLSTQGNFNNEIGLPLTLFKLGAQHQAAVLELGMNHFGEMDRLGAICKPTIGMITNVAAAHLEFMGSLDGVARAKGELIAHIPADGALVLNRDDDRVAAMARQAACRVLFFGMRSGADVSAENIRETRAGVAFDLVLPSGRVPVGMKIFGRFMVANALAAACAGYLTGLGPEDIKNGLEAFTAVKGRLNITTLANGVHVIDDTYNANPSSMRAALATLAALKGAGRAYVVLGCMLELGSESARLHREVGAAAAAAGPARLYAFGPQAADLLEGACSAGMPRSDVFSGGKEEIADDLTSRLEPGDWILIKGSRGMAMETLVAMIRNWAGDR